MVPGLSPGKHNPPSSSAQTASIAPHTRDPLRAGIANIADSPRAHGQTINIIEDQPPTAWAFARFNMPHNPPRPRDASPSPTPPALLLAHFATFVARTLFGESYKLPGILMPIRYRARFRSLQFSSLKLQKICAASNASPSSVSTAPLNVSLEFVR